MSLIFKHFWVACIVTTCLNGLVWWQRGRKKMAENPALEPGYRRLVRGWLIYANLPWVVMGAGIVFGGVPSAFHYLSPKNGPYVIAFYVTVVALWIASFYWIFFRRGAEALIEYPGLLNLPTQNPVWVKVMFLASLTGSILGLSLMIFHFFDMPR